VSAERAIAVIAPACLLVACAQDIPGIAPPSNRFFFPTGMTCVPGSTSACDFIAVTNSNFDQRYNAGAMMLLSTAELFRLAPAPTSSTAVTFSDDPAGFASAIVSLVRVPQFGGELLFVPDPNSAPNGIIFQPSRGNNQVTAVTVRDGKLDCASAGGDKTLGAIDCTNPYLISTRSLDPYSLAYHKPSPCDPGDTTCPPKEVIAVGHLRGESQPPPSTSFSLQIPLIDVELFRRRIAAHDASIDPLDAQTPFPNIPGATGIVFCPASAIHSPFGSFLVAQRFNAAGFPVTLASFDFATDAASQGADASTRRISLNPGQALPIGVIADATELRGVALSGDGRRAYVATRFQGIGTTYNSAIAVVAVDTTPFTLLSLTEVGDELEHPFVRERTINGRTTRFLYVPDVRRDMIFVLDATEDLPLVVQEITGRVDRELVPNDASTRVTAHTLDAPASIVFAEDRDGRSLAFVSNFSNATISIIDVTDIDPREHRVIARLGSVIYPDKSGETPP
jgi:hypothetical protein